MSETERLLSGILSELKTMNGKLDAIIGEIPSDGTPISLADINKQLIDLEIGPFSLSSIAGDCGYSLTDIYSKLDDIMGLGSHNSLADIYDKISD